ncbi:protein of unknown function [Taphrina deformans PYCC 5710]|uniref:3'-5' exonuclease n=1 Tax=Taphrina deformans (strain PYCC 5710 / ATCC 11124 / CBS 356.35 / IMI 108563 / JCM 9778 / NBRC 8474) TaxID=1097556 RepID=R4XJS1_TAPDE|nr:protein of unknown function [Taphrina deformans PYCC 5710]|eukprot:CCG83602.1 protein of unknown function [Taphrina deformans PYCC 5710]
MARGQQQAAQAASVPVVPRGIYTRAFGYKLSVPVASRGEYASEILDITFTNSSQIADDFVDEIYESSASFIGFDLEHRPTYRPGQKANISLLQFAAPSSRDRSTHPVLVYSIYHDSGKIPDSLEYLLRDPRIEKYGVGIRGDVKHLRYLNMDQDARDSFKELAPIAFQKGLVDRPTIGLKALIAATMGEECTAYKTQSLTMTNWELPEFSTAQLKYAAMDAFAGLEIWQLLDGWKTSNAMRQNQEVSSDSSY